MTLEVVKKPTCEVTVRSCEHCGGNHYYATAVRRNGKWEFNCKFANKLITFDLTD